MQSIIFIISIFFVYLIDKKLNKVIEPYIIVETERLTNNIVNKKINEIMDNFNMDSILLNNDNNVSYNTKELNKIKNRITQQIQDELMNLDNGYIDNYFIPTRITNGKFKNVKRGILCDISIGSIRGSTLFSNVGPSIPIKLLFSSQLNSDIKVEVKEYGINNVIVEIYYVIDIKEQITMPMTSKRKKIHIKEPLSIEIINGKIPQYYNGYIK